MALGALFGPKFTKYGRRKTMLYSLAVLMVLCLLSAVGLHLADIVVLRFLVGVFCGFFCSLVPIYISEVSPADKRGKYGILHQLFLTFGILLSSLIAVPLPAAYPIDNVYSEAPMFVSVYWRVNMAACVLPCVIAFLLLWLCFDYETPFYYYDKGQQEDVKKLLALNYCRPNVEKEYADLVNAVKMNENLAAKKVGLLDGLRSASFRTVILVAIAINISQQLTGINIFMTSSNALFVSAGLSGVWPTIVTVLMNALNSLMTFAPVYLIEKKGRKWLLVAGSIGIIVSVLPATVLFWLLGTEHKASQILAIAGSLLFICFFAATFGGVVWVYTFEIFPDELRMSCAGACVSINWLTGIVLVFVAQYVGIRTNFTIFTVLNILVLAFCVLCIKETKGLPLGKSPYIKEAETPAAKI
uniref:Solute carrier family 2, facilitated glucose transporter member 1-like n=1 Tax=Dermatophagoides pteronyssinus TaxID=6956 RepID=A0A6P6Y8H0_DERPT|nr:solute carrier family 2, facilitated glucose transporter member 1-like [Dermatophagoides pteronyssinus]